MPRKHLLLLTLVASTLGACDEYDAPPYPGAPYQRYGSGYNTRYGYDDPWQVGASPARQTRSPSFSTIGSYGFSVGSGYNHGFGGHHHGPSCGCSSCRSGFRNHDDHKHSSHKKSTSSHKSSSSSNKSKSKSKSKSSGSSKSDRAAEWQKDKGGNPRARRRSPKC